VRARGVLPMLARQGTARRDRRGQREDCEDLTEYGGLWLQSEAMRL